MNAGASPDTGAADGTPADGVERPSGRRRVLATAGVMSAIFLGAVGQTSLVTAMPAIVADLGGFDRYTWALTAYLVASTVVTPIAGRLADIYGRRVFFVVGLAILMAASAPVVLVTDMMQLVLLRAVQGLGGGIVMANSVTAVADLYAARERGRVQGLIGAVVFLSVVVGPLLAGFLTDVASWRWIFLLNVPAGLLVLGVILYTFPRARPAAADSGLDFPGMAALTAAVTAVMLALARAGEQQAWTSPQVGGLLAFGLVAAAAFVLIESRADAPVMPPALYRNRAVAVSAVLMVLASFGLYGNMLFTPLFFQAVQGLSATGSGGILAPLGLGVVLGGIVSGQLLSRTGGHYRLQAVAGTLLMAAGTYLLSSMSRETGLARAAAYLVMVGWGAGATTATLTVAVQNSVPFRMVGAATATLQFWRLISGAAGLAALGGVLAARFASGLEAALPPAVRAALAPGQLDALKSNPRVLGDPSATDGLPALLRDADAAGAGAADALIGALNSALAGAVGDAFTLCAAVTALSVAAAFFLRGGNPRVPPA